MRFLYVLSSILTESSNVYCKITKKETYNFLDKASRFYSSSVRISPRRRRPFKLKKVTKSLSQI